MSIGQTMAMAKVPLRGILGESRAHRRLRGKQLDRRAGGPFFTRPPVSARASLRVTSVGHAAFAAALIVLGVTGLAKGDFPQIWQPVPQWVPARTALAQLCALISVGSGVGLLWRWSAPAASRILLVALSGWLLVMRLPNLFYETPLVLVAWSFGATAVMTAGALVLYGWLAPGGERSSPRFADAMGQRIARTLYGLSLIPFGLAHFMYLDATTVLIPAWLPWHVAWAYLTGATFIAAGLAVSFGVLPRLAATLSALQMGLFSLIVWVPRAIVGNLTEFQRGEVITTWVLTAGAWVVAESYRGIPWLAVRQRSRG